MKKLLIAYHSQSGRNQAIALACYQAAKQNTAVQTVLLPAMEVESGDIISADALLLITPEMNGMISGGMKDMLDRVFYPLERAEKQGLPYAAVINCGNAGQSAAKQIERIMAGIRAQPIQETLLLHGEPDKAILLACQALSEAMATGLEMGIF